MEPIANLDCALKINVGCDFCKMKIMEVMNSIAGIYSVTIDGEAELLKFTGEVDPNIVMRALARTGKHAELKWAKLDHPLVTRNNNYNSYNNNNYGYDYTYGNNYYGRVDDPYTYRRPSMLRGYNSNYALNDYSQTPSCCACHHSTRRLAPEYNNYPYHSSNYYQYSQPPPLPPLRAARNRAFYY